MLVNHRVDDSERGQYTLQFKRLEEHTRWDARKGRTRPVVVAALTSGMLIEGGYWQPCTLGSYFVAISAIGCISKLWRPSRREGGDVS